MEIFTINSTTYTDGDIVNGIDSLLWVERYREGGEFTIICDPLPNLREKLAVGSMISHSDTLEVMMVENHEISESKGEEKPKLTITGRTVEQVIMENRIVVVDSSLGSDDHTTETSNQYHLVEGDLEYQIVMLIKHFLKDSEILYQPLPNFDAYGLVTIPPLDVVNRDVKIQTLYESVVELLSIYDWGIRSERPSQWIGAPHDTMAFVVHNGADKRADVQFNHLNGDLDNARYYWSNKAYKNYAVVIAKYYGTLADWTYIDPDYPFYGEGWTAREVLVDASDFSDYYEVPEDPMDPEYQAKLAAMEEVLINRGLQALTTTTKSMILDATISKEAKFKYRRDYNLGDIVHVLGNYGVSQPMRVTEYAETMDENGESGFPTVTKLDV